MTPKKKAQVSVYLDPDVMKALSAYAARREQSMSLVAEAAIASFLSPDADERREAAIAKRLDQQDRRLARLERADEQQVRRGALGLSTRTPGSERLRLDAQLHGAVGALQRLELLVGVRRHHDHRRRVHLYRP